MKGGDTMNKTNHEDKKMKMSNATAGTVGAVVGGMVGAAAGIALSDKNKRRVIMQKMEQLKKYLNSSLDEIAQMSQDSTDMIAEPALPKVKKAKKRRAN